MSTFKPVDFTYKGQTLTVAPAKVLRLIAAIEQNFDLTAIQSCKTFSAATLALNYAPVLTAAGFKAVDEGELALSFMRNPNTATEAILKCIDLMKLLQAPEDIIDSDATATEDTAEKKPTAA